MLATKQQTITSTAARIDIAAFRSGWSTLTIINTGSVTAYIGDSAVTSSTGFPLAAGAVLTITKGQGNNSTPYAITASSTTTCAVMQVQ